MILKHTDIAGPIDQPDAIPDAPSTLQAQMDQVRSGKRRAMLIGNGAGQIPTPPELRSVDIPEGKVVYHPKQISSRHIRRAAQFGALNQVFGAADGGMGPQSKQDIAKSGQSPVAVVGKDSGGTPVQETLTTPDKAAAAEAQTAKVTPPGGSVSRDTPDNVLTQRTARLAKEGVEINRGSVPHLPLAERGHQEAAKLGQKAARAGGFDHIIASDANRTMATAQAVAQRNPKPVAVQPNKRLQSWRQGNFEGQPKKAVDKQLAYFRDNPQLRIPGQGPLGALPGESRNDFLTRNIGAVAERMHALPANLQRNPQYKELIMMHSQGIKALKGWLAAGTPEDFTQINESVASSHSEDPAGIQRLWPDSGGRWQLKNDDMSKAGIWIGRHAETPWSKEAYRPGKGRIA